MNIRKAVIQEADDLTQLAIRSKAYWGYSDEFIESCRAALTITPEFIAAAHVYVVEDEGKIQGFIALEQDGDSSILSDVFIDPSAVRLGYGRVLWQHIMGLAKELGIPKVIIHSDPHAEGFYLSMGAKRIGDVESTVTKGRFLPLMEIVLS
ncbi:GNAT family N-acetyltransferase [Paenibacillus albiflavus]|uniref:GNAT family N-acetyltransferase n=1 Tax=Paenibacillus albiflavus TaxID=2545760 RepID=A0A4R4EEW8_9BACL|nr:GNAT family N-acetyltransferase [Paenibacillus albiflavus]TCZ76618.1 GNAT family N-acetyltransferase [Paenibacillus albiflavus]